MTYKYYVGYQLKGQYNWSQKAYPTMVQALEKTAEWLKSINEPTLVPVFRVETVYEQKKG